MTIFTEPYRRETYIEELQVGPATAASAVAAETLVRSPTASLYRGATQLYKEYGEESPLLTADEARKRVSDANVKLTVPDTGIKENQLNYLINLKNEEIKRQSLIDRGPDGFFPGMLNLGASLGASLLDPINVASAFIPVYGQARYTSMLDNAVGALGRAGVRARVGAVEGAVGTALVEPIVYATARYEQADYDMTDSLEALAFGTVFGGGLHMGVGALGDAFARAGTSRVAQPVGTAGNTLNAIEPEARADVFRAAMGQVLSGRNLDIEAILDINPRFQNATTRALETTSLVPMRQTDPLLRRATSPESALGTTVNPEIVEPPNRVTIGAMNSKGEIPVYTDPREAERIQKALLNRTGEQLDIIRLDDGTYTLLRPVDAIPVRNPDGRPMSFDTERAAIKASQNITDLRGRNLTPIAFIEDGEVKFALVENAPKDMAEAAKKNPRLVDLGLAADRSVNAEVKLADQFDANIKYQSAFEAARNSFRPENLRLADVEMSRFSDAQYQKAMMPERIEDIEAELNGLLEDTKAMSEAADARAEFDAEIAKADAEIENIEQYNRGIEAAAACSLRRG